MAYALIFALTLAANSLPVRGQFGNGYIPPAPVCPLFKCPANEKAVPVPDFEIVSYGCKKSGAVLEALDPNDIQSYGKNGGMNLNRCCIERDVCRQTCGMTARDCHDDFHKCSQKICKNDQSCQMQAILDELSPDPYDEGRDKTADKKCHGYLTAQQAACECVPKADVRDANEARLKAFYAKHNPEKLDDSGAIKDVEEVWKKWKGFEPKMFKALAIKYKDKAVRMLTGKFTPKPLKDGKTGHPLPPQKDTKSGSNSSSGAKPREGADAAAYTSKFKALEGKKAKAIEDENYELAAELKVEIAALKASKTEEIQAKATATAFASKFKKLEAKKAKAIEDEDYDLAAEMKAEIAALKASKAEEIERLNARKREAIAAEDYEAANKVKEQIAKLEL